MAGRRQQGEGSVYQTARGRWVAVADLGWRNGKRDRREFTGKTPDEAIRKRREWFDKRAETGFTPPRGRAPYVSEWVRHWLYHIAKPQVSEDTWGNYRDHCEQRILPWFERVKMDELNADDIRAWHAHMLETPTKRTGRPPARSTIGITHGVLSMALNAAMRERPRRLAYNPARDVPPPPADREDVAPPDEDEVAAILAACEDRRTGARWAVALGTGQRRGETLGTMWPLVDIEDPDNAWIDVQWQLRRSRVLHGCEDPGTCGPAKNCPQRTGGGLVLRRPKSESSRAPVPVPRFAALMLREHKKRQLEERLAAGPAWQGWAHDCGKRLKPKQLVCPDCRAPARPDLLVFTRPDGRPTEPNDDLDDWAALLEEAGVEYYNPHLGTRHQAATALLEEGVDIRVVQEIMRHASPDFTRKFYQHVKPRLQSAAAQALDRRMGRGR